jgi:hypothetical protein
MLDEVEGMLKRIRKSHYLRREGMQGIAHARAVAAVGFEDGLQDELGRRLDPTISDRGDAQLEHAVALFKLRGGGDEEAAATGMLTKVPAARLVILSLVVNLERRQSRSRKRQVSRLWQRRGRTRGRILSRGQQRSNGGVAGALIHSGIYGINLLSGNTSDSMIRTQESTVIRRMLCIAGLALAVGCGSTALPEEEQQEELLTQEQAVDPCGFHNQPACSAAVTSSAPSPHNLCYYHRINQGGTCKNCGYSCNTYWCTTPSYPPRSSPPCPYAISNQPSTHAGCVAGSFAWNNGGVTMCRTCGINGEMACPFTTGGYNYNGCQRGTGNFNGYCHYCGDDGQPACPYPLSSAPYPHNYCYYNSTNDNGVCRQCGHIDQPACTYAISNQHSPDETCYPGLANIGGYCRQGPIVNVIGYGQMGRRDGAHQDVCQSGLTPMNVDSTDPYYGRAPDGFFSCWHNSPDVLCKTPGIGPISGYIYVRECWHSPWGFTQYFGCDYCN